MNEHDKRPGQVPDRVDDTSEAKEYDVQRVHAQVIREHNEPRDGSEPIPVWMAIVFGGLMFWGGMYMASNSGDYRKDVYDRHEPKALPERGESIPTDAAGLKTLGEKIFNNCAGCHQPSGEGKPKEIPPLNKSEWVAGDKASTARLARILLYGLQGKITVRENEYSGAMPAWGTTLKDHQIAAVLTYIRMSWDNKADPVFTRDIEAARKVVGARSSSMTVAELEAILIEYVDPGATPPSTPKK